MPQLSPGGLAYLVAWAAALLFFFLPILLFLPNCCRRPRLKSRAPFALCMVQTLAAFALITVHSMHLASTDLMPCPFLNFVTATALPTLLFCILLRYVHLGTLYWSAANKLAQGRQRDRIGLAEEAGALNSSGAEVREDIEAGEFFVRLGAQARWRLRALGIFSVVHLARLGVLALFSMIVALVVVQVLAHPVVWSAVQCPLGRTDWIVFASGFAAVILLALPVATIGVTGVRDVHGIRVELDVSFAFFVLCVVSQFLMQFLGDHVAWLGQARNVVGNGQVWIFLVLCLQFITILLPMLESWRADAVEQSQLLAGLLKPPPMRRAEKYGALSEQDSPDKPDFERIMMDDPKLLREFRFPRCTRVHGGTCVVL